MRVPIVVDRGCGVPLQRQIYEYWRQGILGGRFRPGDRIPSTRELSSALVVSRATVAAAYEQLIAEGYFDSAQGSGTFVCRELSDHTVTAERIRKRREHQIAPVRLSRYAVHVDTGGPTPRPAAGVINLSKFGPDLDHFPFDLWRRLLTRHLRSATSELFAHPEHAIGHAPLREEIAAYASRSRAVRCEPDQIVVVNGSQQALDLCMRLLVDVGKEVAVEDPGYPGARQLAAAHGARLNPVGITRDGLRISDISDDARLVYVTPSHQFPTGVSMSVARRLELIEWARSRGAVIIEDDYDSEYRYSGPPLPALQGLTDTVPVIYLGTFSNVMFPGLRIGYVIVPKELTRPFERAKWLADRYTPILEQAALGDFLREGHLERHIRRMRRLYKRRRETLLGALARYFGHDATVDGDAAGMFTLVRFSDVSIRARAKRNGVHLLAADGYYLSGRSPNEFVLGFSAIGERAITAGVKRLAE